MGALPSRGRIHLFNRWATQYLWTLLHITLLKQIPKQVATSNRRLWSRYRTVWPPPCRWRHPAGHQPVQHVIWDLIFKCCCSSRICRVASSWFRCRRVGLCRERHVVSGPESDSGTAAAQHTQISFLKSIARHVGLTYFQVQFMSLICKYCTIA